MTTKKAYFTITAGRTGTAWLADFLSKNLDIDCVHEPLDIEDFGVNMPDIKTMRAFNTYGNCDIVKAFWKRKLDNIPADKVYGETNHTLAKCGLLENLAERDMAGRTTIMILRRNKVKQCVSYLVRNDFANVASEWQWYLAPSYRRKIIDPTPFFEFGQAGIAIWYCFEMDARQVYYKRLYSSKMKFIEAELEELATHDGAAKFWHGIGGDGDCILPPRRNQNTNQPTPELVAQVTELVQSVSYDGNGLVEKFISEGNSLG